MGARLSYAGSSYSWKATLRVGTAVVADCGHAHRNRQTGAGNAQACGETLVRAARNSELTAAFLTDAVSAAATARARGARWSDEEARAKAEATLAAWRTAVLAADFHTAPGWAQRSIGATCGCCPVGGAR
jgi:hypothetical protein